ncbi:hypothetical protein GIY56_08285 [Paracoccus sp. YIM 132242]|uniref:Uncharacterized protein n=1 Tax=Paracoccus lichenicola TaxID=2665644 RepID=A0A6L6HQ10_9RHOB|nr:hypothetical protein [Paracoccus lichenicola]MTE00283.1 hypothetical protein [Paracoccus lichenicola]
MLPYDKDPRYGSGAYRRRVRLRAGSGAATGSVNDDYHPTWVRILHDGPRVRDVRSQRDRAECVIDISIPDRPDDATRMQAAVDGVTVHDWDVHGDLLHAPEPLADLSLYAGFAAWAEERFDDAALDAARILQKGAFPTRRRAYGVDTLPRRRADEEPARMGTCLAFGEPSFSVVMNNVGYVRDFTSGMVESLHPTMWIERWVEHA